MQNPSTTPPLASHQNFADSETGTILPHSEIDRGVELFYQPSESIFAAVASEMVALGWSIFPQSSEGRYPGRVFQDAIKWSEDHDLKNKLPTDAALKLWKAHCATSNVACVFGPASSHAFALDIDCPDPSIAAHLVALADKILGYTSLRREGRAPKIALIYRHAPDDAVSTKAVTLDRVPDPDDKQLVEIQGAGKLLTFHGKHHRTGRYFKWLNDSPMEVGPLAATLVTSGQVTEYLAAIEEAYGVVRHASSAGFGFSMRTDTDGFRKPTRTNGAGVVESGRHQHMRAVVFATVKANADVLLAACDRGPTAVDAAKASIAAVAVEIFSETAALTGKWDSSHAKRSIIAEVAHTATRLLNGDIPARSNRTRTTLMRTYQKPVDKPVQPTMTTTPPRISVSRSGYVPRRP